MARSALPRLFWSGVAMPGRAHQACLPAAPGSTDLSFYVISLIFYRHLRRRSYMNGVKSMSKRGDSWLVLLFYLYLPIFYLIIIIVHLCDVCDNNVMASLSIIYYNM